MANKKRKAPVFQVSGYVPEKTVKVLDDIADLRDTSRAEIIKSAIDILVDTHTKEK